MAEQLRIQLCYALPGTADLTDIEVSEGQTLEQVIHASGLLSRHPEMT